MEPVLVSAMPLGDSVATGPFMPSQAVGSSDKAIHYGPGHITTSRGSLEPVANLEDLQPGLQGNWVNRIDEHFSMAPSLLGLKCIQMAESANNALAVSEEGLLLWKKHFQEEHVENKSSFTANIPVSWFNFIVHLLLSPDKFDWTVKMLKSGMWELVSVVENMDHAFLFYIPHKCPASHAPICQAINTDEQVNYDQGKENIGQAPNMQDVESQDLLHPFGSDNLRKRRNGKTPLVETEVRRSDRIKKDNAGFRRNSCSNNNCLPCNAAPPIIQKSVVKNLTASFYKVAERELEDKLAKKPRRRLDEDPVKVSLTKGEDNPSNTS